MTPPFRNPASGRQLADPLRRRRTGRADHPAGPGHRAAGPVRGSRRAAGRDRRRRTHRGRPGAAGTRPGAELQRPRADGRAALRTGRRTRGPPGRGIPGRGCAAHARHRRLRPRRDLDPERPGIRLHGARRADQAVARGPAQQPRLDAARRRPLHGGDGRVPARRAVGRTRRHPAAAGTGPEAIGLCSFPEPMRRPNGRSDPRWVVARMEHRPAASKGTFP